MMDETRKVYEFYGTQAVEAAAQFYDRSPDGQYDAMIADILRAILADTKADE